MQIYSVICPHCRHEFEGARSIIEALNASCGVASLGHPESTIGDYRVFFRGWFDCQSSLDLIGICLAVNESQIYYAQVGVSEITPLQRGEPFNVDYQRGGFSWLQLPRDSAVLVVEVNKTMDALKEFIRGL